MGLTLTVIAVAMLAVEGAPAASPIAADEAIRRAASEAGLSVVFDRRLIDPKKTIEFDRTQTPDRALADIAAGLDMEMRPVGPRTFALVPAARTKPPTPHREPERFEDTILVSALAMREPAFPYRHRSVTVGEERIRAFSATNAISVLSDLPQVTASLSSANTIRLGANTGVNLADIRTLGPQRTAVRVEGMDRTPFFHGTGLTYAVDVTTLPRSLIESVEVTDLGRVAGGGDGAPAGSVDFSVKRDIEGVLAGARYGASEEGDAEETQLHLALGKAFLNSKARAMAAWEHTEESGLLGRDRDYLGTPWGFAVDGKRDPTGEGDFLPGFGGSSVTPDARVITLIGESGFVLPAAPFLPGTLVDQDRKLVPFEGRLDQLYNWAVNETRLIPTSKDLGIVSGEIELSANSRLFALLQLGQVEARSQLAPAPATGLRGGDGLTGSGIFVPLDHPTVPEELLEGIPAFLLPSLSGFVVERRLTELGNRRETVERGFFEAAIGGDHTLSDLWAMDWHVRRGRTSVQTDRSNFASCSAIAAVIDGTCGPDCPAVDPFARDGFAAVADLISGSSRTTTTVDETEVSLGVHRTLYTSRPFSPTVSLGTTWRQSRIASEGLGEDDVADLVGINPLATAEGQTDAVEAFAKLSMSLRRPQAPGGGLSLEIAGRGFSVTDTGTGGSTEAGLSWSPFPSVTVATSAAYIERAPNLAERFSSTGGSALLVADPCSPASRAADPVINANCASGGPLGVPDGFTPAFRLIAAGIDGNPDLETEKARQLRADVVIDVARLAELTDAEASLRISYTDQRIRDGITLQQGGLLRCYTSVDLSAADCGTSALSGEPLIKRDASGHLTQARSRYTNDGVIAWQGVDIDFEVARDGKALSVLDRASLHFLYSDIFEFEQPESEGFLVGGAPPNSAGSLVLSGGRGFDDVLLQITRQGKAKQIENGGPVSRIDPFVTVDVSWQRSLGKRATFTASVRNLLDAEPQILPFNGGENVIAGRYDIIGRRFHAGLEVQF